MTNPIRLDVSGLAGIPEAARRLAELSAKEMSWKEVCEWMSMWYFVEGDPVFQEVV